MERGGCDPSTIGSKTLTLLHSPSRTSTHAPATSITASTPASTPIATLTEFPASFPTTPRHRRSKALAPALQQRNQRLERYGDLVRPIAWHYAHRCPETAEDLQQVGLLGLLRAAELYQESLGTPFSAFARPHIRGAILHYLRDQARPVRLPRRVQELEDRLRAVRRQIEASLGRLATDKELRLALGMSEGQWQAFEAAQRISRPCSLSDLEDHPLVAADEEECPREPREADLVLRALNDLDPQRQRVIRSVVLEGRSLRQTAAALAISPMTVSRQLRRGLDQLRSTLESRPGWHAHPAC